MTLYFAAGQDTGLTSLGPIIWQERYVKTNYRWPLESDAQAETAGVGQ